MDVGLLILRLSVGLLVAAHGSQKLLGWFGGGGINGTVAELEGFGFSPLRSLAWAVGAAQLLGGLLLAAGTLVPLGATLVACTMAQAARVSAPNGFWSQRGGLEYPLLLTMASISLVATGPGALGLAAHPFIEPGAVTALGAAGVATVATLLLRPRNQPTTRNLQ